MVEWKPIFDGVFEVSSDGRIRRVLRTDPRQKLGELKQSRSGSYVRLTLRVNGKAKSFSVHQLVLLAFVGPCPEGHESAHLNGNGTDNRLENLAYKTHLENEADKRIHWNATTGREAGCCQINCR